MKPTLRALFLLAVLAAAPGCFFIDLGITNLGRIQEVTVVDAEDVDEKILLLPIDGVITDEPSGGGILSTGEESTVARVRQQLEIAQRDESVRAVILRVNSPGGGVTASDVIHREIQRYKAESKRPVVALFMDTAASGGYYVAQAADAIVAHPTTVTGSIGVISMIPNLGGLLEKIGVEVNAIKSGEKKDLGNPFRRMNEDERRIFQTLVDSFYGRFLEVILAARKDRGLTPDGLRLVADGRILTGKQALDAKLVDRIGYFDDALKETLARAGLAQARVVMYERKGIGQGGRTIYSQAGAATDGAEAPRAAGGGGGGTEINVLKVDAGDLARLFARGPVFQYLWVPGE